MSSNLTDYRSYGEISSQPEAWSELISMVIHQEPAIRKIFSGIEEVIFTGCGSGLNASLTGAPIFQAMGGISARAVPAVEIYRFPDIVLNRNRKTLAVLSSRSGKTTEVVNAMRYLKDRGLPTLGITCTEGSPLALESSLALVLTPVFEQAVITTRSLTGMILVLQLISAIVGRDGAALEELKKLPLMCAEKMDEFQALGKVIGQRTDIQRYSFLGNGPFYGVAHESQLKIKEMVLLPSDSYPALDFRHGPQSNVDPHMLVTVFLSDSAAEDEIQLLRDMQKLGGVTWAICDRMASGSDIKVDYLLETNSGLGAYTREILYLPAIHFMAYYRAIACGLNPDEPHNLSYWIDTSR